MRDYIHYTNITREILDTIKVGDLVKINDWGKPLRVKAVSNNFFVMAQKQFKNTVYSVCSKLPFEGIRYNNMRNGMFHCGTDDSVFGSPHGYEFGNEKEANTYLKDFENGNLHLSFRTSIPVFDLYVKSNT